MGQTRKRQPAKRKGNAAGMVARPEATGSGGAGRGGARGPRVPTPPSWRKAFTKALLPLVILAPFVFLVQRDTPVEQKITLLVFAYVVYVPLSYLTDRFVWSRWQKKMGAGA